MPSPAFVLANGESIDTPKWHKQRRDELERLRQPYLERWDELQRYILPRLGRTFRARGQTSKPPSMDLVIDTTAPQSLGIAAAGMMATITSPARRWMKLTAREQEPGAGVPPAIEEWLQHAEDALFPFWDETNYYGMTEIENVESLLFGTSAGYGTQVTGANEHEFLWRAIPAGQYVIAEDAMGKVDTLYREYVMSVEQVVSRFGTRGADGRIDIEAPTGGEYVSGTFSARLQQMWREGRWDEPVILIQHFGRSPYTGQYLSGEPKWQELVFEAEADMDHVEGNFLSRTMFNVLPLAVSRWETNGVDPYGASPGMEALPDVKQLLEMEEKKAAALSLLINPPLQGPPDAVQNQRISSLPGDVNANDALSAGGAIVPLYEVKPDIPSFEASMEQVRSRIRRAFHADLFLAFMERPGLQPLNDYEAIQRKEEKLLGLGQVVYRKNREAIRPHVEISLDYLNATGRIDDPPGRTRRVRHRVQQQHRGRAAHAGAHRHQRRGGFHLRHRGEADRHRARGDGCGPHRRGPRGARVRQAARCGREHPARRGRGRSPRRRARAGEGADGGHGRGAAGRRDREGFGDGGRPVECDAGRPGATRDGRRTGRTRP